jgi:hypothetical protein
MTVCTHLQESVPVLNNQLDGHVYSLYSHIDISEPEFIDVTRRLKIYLFAKRCLFRGQAAQQGFPPFSFRVVGKIYLVCFHKT